MSDITVLIPTRNRKHELSKAIRSALRQSSNPEVLVIDDCSMDGTYDHVRQVFPTVHIHRSEVNLGQVKSKNLGHRLSRNPVVATIDDDCVFTSSNTLQQTLADMNRHPNIAAVAIPMIEHDSNNEERWIIEQAPSGTSYVTPFPGGCVATKRDSFLQVGGHEGYKREFERSLFVRWLSQGLFSVRGTADPIHHFPSEVRDKSKIAYYGIRNLLSFGKRFVPNQHLLRYYLYPMVSSLFLWTLRGYPMTSCRALLRHALYDFHSTHRKPLPPNIFSIYRNHGSFRQKSLLSVDEALTRIR
ncbi:MAG: glycosyltransferase family A protein [Planctomycetota bacterium]|nr:glycosyltransferase family A protein [Planctomycetota bacterium]